MLKVFNVKRLGQLSAFALRPIDALVIQKKSSNNNNTDAGNNKKIKI
jgi:hypothetical protein